MKSTINVITWKVKRELKMWRYILFLKFCDYTIDNLVPLESVLAQESKESNFSILKTQNMFWLLKKIVITESPVINQPTIIVCSYIESVFYRIKKTTVKVVLQHIRVLTSNDFCIGVQSERHFQVCRTMTSICTKNKKKLQSQCYHPFTKNALLVPYSIDAKDIFIVKNTHKRLLNRKNECDELLATHFMTQAFYSTKYAAVVLFKQILYKENICIFYAHTLHHTLIHQLIQTYM